MLSSTVPPMPLTKQGGQQTVSAKHLKWPYERFPSPPPDGYIIQKSGHPLPNTFPRTPSYEPLKTSFSPPVVASVDVKDPVCLDTLAMDVMHFRANVETCIGQAEAEMSYLLNAEDTAGRRLRLSMDRMQEFLNLTSKISGRGFVNRTLARVRDVLEETYENDEESSQTAAAQIDSAEVLNPATEFSD